jgi:hypothetical protein
MVDGGTKQARLEVIHGASQHPHDVKLFVVGKRFDAFFCQTRRSGFCDIMQVVREITVKQTT